MYVPVKAIEVFIWGRRVGVLTHDYDQYSVFELPDGYEHWLIKFTPKGMEDAGEKEYEVSRKALACGIEMSECRLLELDGAKHFMTKRFGIGTAKRALKEIEEVLA